MIKCVLALLGIGALFYALYQFGRELDEERKKNHE